MITSTSQQSQTPALSATPAITKKLRHQIVFIGGGSAGLTTASMLLKKKQISRYCHHRAIPQTVLSTRLDDDRRRSISN